MREFGVEPEITISARILNERLPNEVCDQLVDAMSKLRNGKEPKNITLCGLAFKGRPATDDLRGTTARQIFDAIHKRFPDAKFRGYDAMVKEKSIDEFGLQPCQNLEEAFQDADLLLILNNHTVFESMPLVELAGRMKGPGIIYDFWNNFDARELALPNGIIYIGLGARAHSLLPKLKREILCH